MKREYHFFVYIMVSKSWVLYIGMKNDLIRRVTEHKEWKIEWFSKRYQCKKLVYFDFTKYVYNAINREKELKHFLRRQKIMLIESENPHVKDLSSELQEFSEKDPPTENDKNR